MKRPRVESSQGKVKEKGRRKSEETGRWRGKRAVDQGTKGREWERKEGKSQKIGERQEVKT